MRIRIKKKRVATNTINLYFLKNQLKKKFLSKLLFMRKAAVTLQIFFIWFDKNNSAEMIQLIHNFDKSLNQVFENI